MKKFYTLLVVALVVVTAKAQIINFPTNGSGFKSYLVNSSVANLRAKDLSGNYFAIDANHDGEIQISEALQVSYINIYNGSIYSLVGINEFLNLTYFSCTDAILYDIDIHGLHYLETFIITYSSIQYATFYDLPVLKTLSIWYNHLTALDVSQIPSLMTLNCYQNYITSLDLSMLTNLTSLCCNNNQLVSLNIKNGSNQTINGGLIQGYAGSPTLRFICVDDSELAYIQNQVSSIEGSNLVVINSYCSFIPGGEVFNIIGNTKFDFDANGCSSNDIDYANLKIAISDGTNTTVLIPDTSGSYHFTVQEGTQTIIPILENPTYYSITPSSSTITFPETTSPFTQDFCVTANANHHDLEVSILPILNARPGYDAAYVIFYKNKGTDPQNGTINLGFNDTVLDYVSSSEDLFSQTNSSLSWNFYNLNSFETRSLVVYFNLNSPLEIPPLNVGDILNYTATISGATDETPEDNTATLNQTVKNSLDPNNKTCMEGVTITPSMVGQYVHYIVRFENDGTANAQNIVVKDMIDTTKFDISTLVPLSGSASYTTRITDNKVEFIFENINLPYTTGNNTGYIAFKIKTKPTLVLGNTFSNRASIYFDYNAPIVTNTAITTIATLATQDFDFGNYFSVYPVPAKQVLHLQTKAAIGVKLIEIYNVVGQMVIAIPDAESVSAIDVSNLKTGTYFIKVTTDKGMANAKFVKE